MADRSLAGCRILVAEDEYFLADEMAMELEERGAIVLGPAPSVEHAWELIENVLPDAAVLDVNLGGEPVLPVADVLIERGVRVILTSGYDASALPERFARVPRCDKPINIVQLTRAVERSLRTGT